MSDGQGDEQQMTIDPTAGDVLPLAAVCVMFPAGRQGRPLSLRTLKRWAKDGCRAADGSLIRLAMTKAGSRLLTSRAAVKAFVARLGRAAAVEGQDRPLPTSHDPGGAE